MKAWKIELNTNDAFKKELTLYDVRSIFDGYLRIKRSYFNSLVKALKISKNYKSISAINKVYSPSNEDLSENPWMLIVVKDTEKNFPIWFLIKREKDLTGLLICVGPKIFADYSFNNANNKREIIRMMNYIVAYINKFSCVVFLPNFIGKKE